MRVPENSQNRDFAGQYRSMTTVKGKGASELGLEQLHRFLMLLLLGAIRLVFLTPSAQSVDDKEALRSSRYSAAGHTYAGSGRPRSRPATITGAASSDAV